MPNRSSSAAGMAKPLTVRWNKRLRLGMMTDNLNIVTVRSNDEGRIVIGVIVRPNPRSPVVFASRSESLTIELVYLTSIVCREREVKG